MTKVTCKHCGSIDVLAVDNQPLYHPTKDEYTPDYRYDNELYMEFKCMSCDGYSTTVFTLTPKE
jgi:ribosomal protein S27E